MQQGHQAVPLLHGRTVPSVTSVKAIPASVKSMFPARHGVGLFGKRKITSVAPPASRKTTLTVTVALTKNWLM